MSDGLLQNATPPPEDYLGALDLKITRAWKRLLKAQTEQDIDKHMAYVDGLLDERFLLMKANSWLESNGA